MSAVGFLVFAAGCTSNVTRAPASNANPVVMSSPSATIRAALTVDTAGVPFYTIDFHDRQIFAPATMGLKIDRADFSRGLELQNVNSRDVDAEYDLPVGKTSHVRDRYRAYDFQFNSPSGLKLTIEFRLYDDGVAFRYFIPPQPGLGDFQVLEEATQIVAQGRPQAHALPLEFGSAYEEKYATANTDRLAALLSATSADGQKKDRLIGLPLVLTYENAYVSMTEAALHAYPHAYLSPVEGSEAFGFRYPPGYDNRRVPIAATNSLRTPWRAFMIGASPKTVFESNLISNLSDPSVIKDTSWIRPGKVLFQWWNGYVMPGRSFSPPSDVLNGDTLKYQIDFCAKHGIEYFSLDGYEFDKAWYGGKVMYEGQDVTKAAPEIRLPEVLAYAASKGVRARAWLHTAGLTDENMERVLTAYTQMGISSVMVDFYGDDTQVGTTHMEKVLRAAAKHRLNIAFHGNAKPTGWQRTYPNYLTQEGVLGQEYNKWPGHNSAPDHEVNIALIRQTAGPMDTHEGSFRPVPLEDFKPVAIAPHGIGTLARQLAMYVVYENEQPMLADFPAAYEKHAEALAFISDVPVSWDQSVLLMGDLDGAFISVARRKGDAWFLGSMNGAAARNAAIALDFLGPGRYRLDLYEDTPESSRNGEKIRIRHDRIVTARSVLHLRLAPAGGQVARLRRAD